MVIHATRGAYRSPCCSPVNLLRLAVGYVAANLWVVLLELKAAWIITAILHRRVGVAALGALQLNNDAVTFFAGHYRTSLVLLAGALKLRHWAHWGIVYHILPNSTSALLRIRPTINPCYHRQAARV